MSCLSNLSTCYVRDPKVGVRHARVAVELDFESLSKIVIKVVHGDSSLEYQFPSQETIFHLGISNCRVAIPISYAKRNLSM